MNALQRPRSLRRSIVMLNVVLVLLATLSIGLVSLHLLNRQANSHALQVVELSGTQVRDTVARVPDELLATAIILRDRPTLARYVRERNWRQLEPFLEQYRAGGSLDYVALVLDGQLVSEAGQRVPDEVLFQSGPEVRAHTVWARADETPRDEFSAVAIAPLPDGLFAGVGYVVVSRQITQRFLDSLSLRPGTAIVMLSRSRLGQALPDTPERQILLSEQALIRALPESQRFVAALPLRDEQGRMIAGVMTYLPAAPFERNRNRLLTRWLIASLVLALLAAMIGTAIGRRLGRPIRALTQAARRMAEQDFATPVPPARDIELDVLSSTMEDMRRRVLDLTATVRRREAQAQNLLENIVEGVFSVDEQRRILYMNPQAARLLGVDGGHAIGRFCGDVLKPRGEGGRLPCHVNCPIIHARSGSGSRAHEVLCVGEEQRSVVIHSAPPSGNQQVQIIRDETQTEAGRRLRDAVIANVSHEFKTPLAAQTAAIELLQSGRGSLDAEQSAQLIEAMSRSTVRLNQLIDNLLESVRIDAREDRIDLHLLHIEDVIEQAVGVVDPLLLQRRQCLTTKIQPEIPEFLGDGQRLIQVLVNLLSNAIKYAPEETAIQLDISTVGQVLRIVLEDEGPGLAASESEAIFDRFYRAPGLSAGRAGMGLGLWIVKSIVQRHGGRIEFARTRAGGSSFRVFLPLKQEEA
ncbi:MAG: HAMP domain-containing protein [Wenzhouxiangella sp.]|nr:MAG: HAMP domain-containing protein [Wenzhouxiangella sp.]